MEETLYNYMNANIIYNKSPAYEMGEHLISKGYEISDICGHRDEIREDGFGILEPKEPSENSFLWFKWKCNTRSLFIGYLYKDDNVKNKWILHVYGKDKLSELVEMLKHIVNSNKLTLEVNLAKETADVERYLSDYD